MIHFVLGGQSSGKSDYALDLFDKGENPRLFIPTGKAMDMDFRQRIADHRLEREAAIPVREAGLDLSDVLKDALEQGYRSIVVDSLDFWLFACLESGEPERHVEEFLGVLDTVDDALVVVVSSEVGQGVVSADSLTRQFVRCMGKVNRRIAERADTAWFVVAGLPVRLKG